MSETTFSYLVMTSDKTSHPLSLSGSVKWTLTLLDVLKSSPWPNSLKPKLSKSLTLSWLSSLTKTMRLLLPSARFASLATFLSSFSASTALLVTREVSRLKAALRKSKLLKSWTTISGWPSLSLSYKLTVISSTLMKQTRLKIPSSVRILLTISPMQSFSLRLSLSGELLTTVTFLDSSLAWHSQQKELRRTNLRQWLGRWGSAMVKWTLLRKLWYSVPSLASRRRTLPTMSKPFSTILTLRLINQTTVLSGNTLQPWKPSQKRMDNCL